MTIVSTAETVSPLDAGEGSLDLFESKEQAETNPSFPPVSDTIAWFKQVDWEDVRNRCRGGFNNCGLVIAVMGEKMHDLGCWMSKV